MRCEPRPGSYAPHSPLGAVLKIKGFLFLLPTNVLHRFTLIVGEPLVVWPFGTLRERLRDGRDGDDHRRAQASGRSFQDNRPRSIDHSHLASATLPRCAGACEA